MIPFEYTRARSAPAATGALASQAGAKLIAGGTNLIDLMKRGVVEPPRLVDINLLPLKEIREASGRLDIGALATNSEVAEHPFVKKHFPLLSMAIQAGASAQLRNMATTGGNMMQRTRCTYFYDTVMPCNKRAPGSGCGALKGHNRMHAIFGASDACIAVHPSDMCVALAALDATVHVTGPKGQRKIPFADFHRLPGDRPEMDNTLGWQELITGISIPFNKLQAHSWYLKVRDRASYAFALVSVAAAIEMDGSRIKDVRLAMGGVAHKPWRLNGAEAFLREKEATEAHFREAARIAMEGARGYGMNDFKLTLAPRSIELALSRAMRS